MTCTDVIRTYGRTVPWGAALLAVILGASTVQAQPTETDSFFSAGGYVPIQIAKDRIEVLTLRGTTTTRVDHFADSLGFDRARRVAGRNDRIYILDIGHIVERDSLQRLIAMVDSAGQGFLADVGMAVTFRPHGIPFLVSRRLVAKFHAGVPKTGIDSINAANAVEIVDADSAIGLYLLRVTPASTRDAIDMAQHYRDTGLVRYAHPDFVHVLVPRQSDPYFGNQWHHENRGLVQSDGTEDADIDTPLAWEIVQRLSPTPEVKIAVIDGGYDMGHEDLQNNLWTDAAGHHGRDYYRCDDAPGPNCWDSDPSWVSNPTSDQFDPVFDFHGTCVAGLIGATRGNDKGLAGVCPYAKLILIRRCLSDFYLARLFRYARDQGASVISCSWGEYIDAGDSPTLHDAIDYALNPGGGLPGSVVLFAMYYAEDAPPPGTAGSTDLAALPRVICVSASTNWDRRLTEAGVGDFVSVLAPSNRGYGDLPFTGSLNIATTDIRGLDGYNATSDPGMKLVGCPAGTESTSDPSYTFCFTGTSAATPIAAGVAGLVRAVRPAASPEVVKRLLQDTADKVEPSLAAYQSETGYSRPASGDPSHGFGRVNAFEAVRVAAGAGIGGKGGVDVFVRDNDLDWGNTEQPSSTRFEKVRDLIGYWRSVDVKVDAGPSWQSATNSAQFDALHDEKPRAGTMNHVYVRVRNRGPEPATGVKVRAYWVRFGAALPRLPDDFWQTFPEPFTNASEWSILDLKGPYQIDYSGATAARDAIANSSPSEDKAQILTFDFPAPAFDPDVPNHYCLLVVVDSDQDHPRPLQKLAGGVPLDDSDFIVDLLNPSDNNVTQRNVQLADESFTGSGYSSFYVRNPFGVKKAFRLKATAPLQWTVSMRGAGTSRIVTLDPHGTKLVKAKVKRGGTRRRGLVTIRQEEKDGQRRTIGGAVFRVEQ